MYKSERVRDHMNVDVISKLKVLKSQAVNCAILECVPMPNVMTALPNIGSDLRSTPQSLADAKYWNAVQ